MSDSRTFVLVDGEGRPVCERCQRADSVVERMRGLLGRRSLPNGEGLLLPRTSSVHTFFMRFPIDVVFLDRDLRVRGVAHELVPYRVAFRLGRGHVLELAAGEARRRSLQRGTTLVRREPSTTAEG